MAAHEIMLRANETPTKTVAPYLGQYVSKGTADIDAIATDASALCGIPPLQLKTILYVAFEQFQELESEMLTYIRTDLGDIRGKIGGSFPTADAAFDPLKNTFELALYPASDVRDYLVNITPTIVTDDTTTKIRVDQVMDSTVPKPYALIHGTNTFHVYGLNLSTADTGAEVYFETSAGVKFPAVVETGSTLQKVKAHLATQPSEGCDGKLWVKSRGGDAEGPLQASFRNVKFLYVAPPAVTFTKIHPIGSTETDVIRVGQGFVCEGTLLTGATAKVKYYTAGSEDEVILDVPAAQLTITATSVTVSQSWVESELMAVSTNKPVTVTLTASGVSVTHDAQFLYPV